jgi:ABC-type antimicrobial peptide transport system permease subunit
MVALEAMAVSTNLFEVLGVSPPLPPETRGVYGDEAWLTPSRGATSRGTVLEGAPAASAPLGALRVIGPVSADFLFPDSSADSQPDAFLELDPSVRLLEVSAEGSTTRSTTLTLVARMTDEARIEQVISFLNNDAGSRGFAFSVRPMDVTMKARHRPLALGALLAALLVLGATTTNTGSFALTRGLHNATQLVTLEILGATRPRLVRILLAEGVMVSSVSTFIALLLLPLLLYFIGRVVPPDFVRLGAPEMSDRGIVFAIATGLLLGTAWSCGSIVAWNQHAGASLSRSLVSNGRTTRTVRFALTAAQVAFTFLLLSSSLLVGRSYMHLTRAGHGLADEAVALSISYPSHLVGLALAEVIEQTRKALERAADVRRAAAVVGQMADDFSVRVMLMTSPPSPSELLWVTSNYFDVAGMSIVAGRALSDDDASMRGAVVNEALARRLFPSRSALGEALRFGRPIPIVGIATDAKRGALDEPARPAFFLLADAPGSGMHVTYILDGGKPAIDSLEQIVRRAYSDAVVVGGGTLRERLRNTIQTRTFAATVLSLFAIATVVVTLAGVSSVVGHGVAQRTREFGIRMALGAGLRHVLWLAARSTISASLLGVALGLFVAVWFANILRAVVYDVAPNDPLTLCVVAVVLITAATLVALVPALRLRRSSILAALRHD